MTTINLDSLHLGGILVKLNFHTGKEKRGENEWEERERMSRERETPKENEKRKRRHAVRYVVVRQFSLEVA